MVDTIARQFVQLALRVNCRWVLKNELGGANNLGLVYSQCYFTETLMLMIKSINRKCGVLVEVSLEEL